MQTLIDNDTTFMHGLTAAQRGYFLRREQQRQQQLQAALRELARGTGIVGQLQGEAMAAALDGAEVGQ